MDRIGLNVGEVLEQAVEKINRLPDPAGDEVGEQGDVGVGDMIVANAAITSVADVVLGEQVLLVQIPFCAVDGSALARSPTSWQGEASVGIDDLANRFIEPLLRNVPPVDPGKLSPVDIAQRAPFAPVRADSHSRTWW